MSIIHRYIIKEFFKYFFIIQITITCIYAIVDYLGYMDDFLKAGMSLFRAFIYVALKIPLMTVQLSPVCTIMSVLIVFSLMNKNNEVLLLKSSGVSNYYLLKPILIIGCIITFVTFVLAESIASNAISEANRIKHLEIRKDSAITSKEDIWLKNDKMIINVKHFDVIGEKIFGITISFFDKNFQLIKRIDAKNGYYKQNQWVLHDIIEQVLNKAIGQFTIQFLNKKVEYLDLNPKELKQIIKKSEEMNFRELVEYIKKIESEGYDSTIYKVGLYAKIAFPVSCIIMCLVGTGLSLRETFREIHFMNIVYGIGIVFFYWVFYSLCLSLGYANVMPSFVAAWVTNLLCFCFAILILLKSD